MSETFYTARPINPNRYFNRYLTNGSNYNMAVDGSVTPVSFAAGPGADKILELARLIFYMESADDFDSDKFMSLPVLSNGVQINVGGVTICNWQDNADVTCCMYDTVGMAHFTKVGRTMAGRWTFTRGTAGEPLLVKSAENVEALIRDDLSGTLIFRIRAQGEIRMA